VRVVRDPLIAAAVQRHRAGAGEVPAAEFADIFAFGFEDLDAVVCAFGDKISPVLWLTVRPVGPPICPLPSPLEP
jgi:hypothetical protein